MRRKFTFLSCFIALFLGVSGFSQAAEQNIASAAFVQGTNAFKGGEWMSAVFMLRRAISYPENFNADTLYMLITAEMYAGEYKAAFQDCETFMREFSESHYISYILYHQGRALFCIGEYDRSVLVLSDFCHQYPEHEMYASALFWVAESFFAGYNYDDAKLLYSRIVSEFSTDAKAPAAQYRLETIAQYAREEKLLYLLKEMGEEYLVAREEYERQVKLSGVENLAETQKRLLEAQHRNADLQERIARLEQEKNDLQLRLDLAAQDTTNDETARYKQMILELKAKALQTQELYEKKASGEK